MSNTVQRFTGVPWLIVWAFLSLAAVRAEPVSDVEPFEYALLRGSEAYDKGRYAECVEIMQEFLEKYRDDPLTPRARKRVYYLLTLSSVRLGRWEEVIGWADKYRSDPGVGAETWDSEAAFWRALAFERLERHDDSYRELTAFAANHPRHDKAPLAIQLAGASLLKAKKWKEAADFLSQRRQSLTGYAAGEALLQELSARLAAGEKDRALELIDIGKAMQDSIPRPAALQLAILRLADEFRRSDDARRSISTLFRLSRRDDVLKRQERARKNLAATYERLQAAEPDGLPARLARAQLRAAKADAAAFEKIPNFDSTARFRIALAFLSLKRYREAAQVLAGMVETLPPDPVVERAADAVVRSYFETRQWEKAVLFSEMLSRKFPASDLLPGALILKGQALQELENYDAADRAFTEMLARFPRHELAPQALFLRAFSSVGREDFSRAASGFREVVEKYPDTPAAESALFWIAQTHSLSREWPATIEGMTRYLEKYPDGISAPEARFRILFAEHAMKNFDRSIPLARAFLEEFPDDPNRAEAFLILGDGLLANGQLDEGVSVLRSTPRGAGSFREESWFRIGKVDRAKDDLDGLRRTMQGFRDEFPTSARLAEAVYWEGWTYRDEPERRRDVYLAAIRKYGADPAQWGVAEMITEMIRESPDDPALRAFFMELMAEANPRPLRFWGGWGLARMDRENQARKMASLAPLIDVRVDNPLILLDIANGLKGVGKGQESVAILKDVRRWNPLSPLNDRVFAGLGLAALENGDPVSAEKYFDRFFEETPGTASRGDVLLASAEARLRLKRTDGAIDRWEEVLKDKGISRRHKAVALLALGDHYLAAAEDSKAAAYYQRVFVLYGAFPDLASRAYLGSAKAIGRLNGGVEEARVLLEFVSREDLSGPQADQARALAQTRLSEMPSATVEQAKEKNAAAQVADVRSSPNEEARQ